MRERERRTNIKFSVLEDLEDILFFAIDDFK